MHRPARIGNKGLTKEAAGNSEYEPFKSADPTPRTARRRGPVGATLAVAHPATLSRPKGARSPIPNPARLRILRTRWRPTPSGVPYRPKRGHRETAWATARPAGAIAWATTSVAPTPRTTRRRGPRRGDPRGRPSRIQHGFVSFVRGGVPRLCGVPYRPKRGHRETAWATARPAGAIAWATTSVAPTPRTTRRRGPRRGDPRGRPSRIQHGFQERGPPVFVCNPSVNISPTQGI